MARRMWSWLVALSIALDQLAHVLLWGPWFVLFGGTVPDPTHTISYTVGKAVRRGNRFAPYAQRAIDSLFIESDHCQRCVDRNDATRI